MKTVKFGVIGTGLMGREFAQTVMRWPWLKDFPVKPEIISICSSTIDDEKARWFVDGLGTVTQVTRDWREVVGNPEVQAVYAAVPNDLHEQIYRGVIRAGKHLMGEKPFGIDKQANAAILEEAAKNPAILVRCVAQMYFTPAAQRLCSMIEEGAFGRIIEVEAGFLHSSDLNPDKPINWKRTIERNGEYGVMGDLGMHIMAIPYRAGWVPKNVRAVLSNIFNSRPDGRGGTAPCDTWDNAVLLCETRDEATGATFPMTLKTMRISPGQKNTWYLSVYGTSASARINSKHINSFEELHYSGGEQLWETIDMGHETPFPTFSGPIFQFSVSDALLQMWASFLYELETGSPKSRFTGCVTPEETSLSHSLFTAALQSQADSSLGITPSL